MDGALIGIISAFGLVLAVEGALYAAFPAAMRRMLATLGAQNDRALRTAGLVSLLAGVVIVWMVRG